MTTSDPIYNEDEDQYRVYTHINKVKYKFKKELAFWHCVYPSSCLRVRSLE